MLIYHEQRKFVPYMVIEALELRSARPVKSFANRFFSIRQLTDLVIDEDEAKGGFEGNSAYRARLPYQMARKLTNDE